MKEFFEQYGGAVVVATAIVALAALIGVLFKTDASGVIYGAFKGLLESFNAKVTF